jgi:hypothetical protein
LYCIYPELFDVEAVLHDSPKSGVPLGSGPNALSAVLRIAVPTDDPKSHSETHVVIGGDLDYSGWHHLVATNHKLDAKVFVVPHHGGPAGQSVAFGPTELAQAVRPSTALISVGTDKNSGAKGYGHPHQPLVRALRDVRANVLCTQLTPQCVASPYAVPGAAVIARDAAPQVCESGVACAGTVAIRLNDAGPPIVRRFAEHATAVDRLHSNGHTPLCRP